MYKSFYGLREKPFNLTPDPRFLYLSKKHKEAFAHLLYGIRNRSGFVEITGEIGTGKTTICRTLLEQADPDIEIAFIFNPYLSATELLRAANEDFGIKSTAVTKKELLDELNAHLLEQRRQGKNCVLLIDEAQNLSTPVLEQIRLLSNLETDTEKLLQIVLVAQPELKETLASPELRQLNQRITARYHLKALDYDEMVHYIAHRITKAGGRGKVRFTKGALKEIFKYSHGTPRLINAVCDRALLIGYTQEKKQLSAAIIKRSAREIEGAKVKAKRKGVAKEPSHFRVVRSAIAAVCAIIVVGFGAYYLYATGFLDELRARAIEPAPVETEPVRVDVPEPNPGDEIESQFMNFVRALTYRGSKRDSTLALAACWGIGQDQMPLAWDNGPIDLFKAAADLGLRCSTVRADLTTLEAIGLPCILELYLPGEERPVYVCLKNLHETNGGGIAVLSKGTETSEEFPFARLEQHWYGRCFYFWRDYENVSEILTVDSVGAEVEWLQSQLRAAGTYEGDITNIYDQETARAVVAIQRRFRIDDDGIAGPNTRMVIYAALDRYETPKLVLEPQSALEGA